MEAEIKWIENELAKRNIHPVWPWNREWPQSLYFGRFRPDSVQIRVSDHEKEFPSPDFRMARTVDILIKEGMTHDEVARALDEALGKFAKIEDEIAEDDL
jgi:hypothetical protein